MKAHEAFKIPPPKALQFFFHSPPPMTLLGNLKWTQPCWAMSTCLTTQYSLWAPVRKRTAMAQIPNCEENLATYGKA